MADRYLVLGSPERAIAQLREFAAAGAESAIVALAAPPTQRDRVFRTLADMVLPAVREM